MSQHVRFTMLRSIRHFLSFKLGKSYKNIVSVGIKFNSTVSLNTFVFIVNLSKAYIGKGGGGFPPPAPHIWTKHPTLLKYINMFRNVQRQDGREYTCFASNRFGSQSLTVQLAVYGRVFMDTDYTYSTACSLW